MIYECMNCVAEEINEFFRHKFSLQEEKVVVSGIVNQDGTLAIQGENKIVLTLLNITKEMRVQPPGMHTVAQKTIAASPPPLCFNLFVLVAAFFSASNYSEALRFLSHTMAFLHEKKVFNTANTPRLPDSVHKLVFEIDSMSPDRLNHVWATLGAKYMPSLVYKVRMLIYNPVSVRGYTPAVSGIADENSEPV